MNREEAVQTTKTPSSFACDLLDKYQLKSLIIIRFCCSLIKKVSYYFISAVCLTGKFFFLRVELSLKNNENDSLWYKC